MKDKPYAPGQNRRYRPYSGRLGGLSLKWVGQEKLLQQLLDGIEIYWQRSR